MKETEDRYHLSYIPKVIKSAKVNFLTGEVVINYEIVTHEPPPSQGKEAEWVYIRFNDEDSQEN